MRRDWAVILLLFAITVAVFARVAHYEFVLYDDPDYILANSYVNGGFTSEGVAWAFGSIHGRQTYWHPLTWLSHMLDCQLFGLKPGPHHLGNVVLHALNVVLLFVLLRRITGCFWRSAAVAALFALHPLQVESVAWVTERKNVLSGMFWLLTMIAYAHYAARPAAGRYLLVLLGFALGLMCKPVLVTLPCVLLLLDFWPLRRFAWARVLPGGTPPSTPPPFAPASVPRLFVEKLPLFALAAVSSWITIKAHAALGLTQAILDLPLSLRLENALVSYARYVGKTLWPRNLAPLYPHPVEWPGVAVLASLLILAAVTAWAGWRLRRAPWLAVGWCWFLGVLVPTSGIIQSGIQAMADRFAYLPSIGLFIMIVWGAAALVPSWPRRPVVLTIAGVAAVMACVTVTSLQLRHWKNSIALFEHALAVTRGNYLMHNNLAYAYRNAGRVSDALPQLTAALRIEPNYAEAHLQMGLILHAQQKLPEAIEHYQAAARFKPGQPFILKNFGSALAGAGRLDEAIEQFSALLKTSPKDPEARTLLAAALAARQRTAEAIDQHRAALRLAPDSPELMNNLAWILATNPKQELRNGAEAVTLAERACDLTQHIQPMFVGTLAAAYAEAGRFESAIESARKAAALARASGDQELAATNEKLLALYQAGQAYHEPSKQTK